MTRVLPARMPRAPRIHLAVAVMFALLPAAALAQSDYRVAIQPGTDVRFMLRDSVSDRRVGRAEGVSGDTLLLSTPVLRVPLRDLSSLEIRGGRDRRRGVVIGAAALGVVTGVAGGVDVSRSNISFGDYIGTLLGNIVVGGAVGYLLAPTGWLQLPLPAR